MDSACMHACMQVGTALSRSAPKERTTSLTGIKEKEDGQTDRQPSTGGVYGDGSTPGLGLPVIFIPPLDHIKEGQAAKEPSKKSISIWIG